MLGLMSPAILALSIVSAIVGVSFGVASARALRQGRALAFSARSFTALLFAALCAACLVLAAATQGYRALTREDVVAEVEVEPAGKQTFLAHVSFPDGQQVVHTLRGDQLYIDAHILKWKPVVNILGLHTAYELDRVAGRYASLDDEQKKPRTVVSIARPKRVDMFSLRQKYAPLRVLLDAEYGSATFVDVKSRARLEIRVSTTGLLVRPKARP
jgi:hypothetical protein